LGGIGEKARRWRMKGEGNGGKVIPAGEFPKSGNVDA